MIYRDYGNTGKKVSIIGFGGMRFLKEEYEGGNFEKCAAIVRRASELGVNYFDTAPYYCDNLSEEIFGEAFKNMPNPFYVSTKTTIHTDPTADAVMARLETSMKRMNVNKVNFLNMWCICSLEQYKNVMKPGGPYDGAVRAKKEGLIDHIVVSTHCEGAVIEQIINEGAFEGVTLGYNALNYMFRQQGIDAAYKKNIPVITMNPLGGGLIATNPEYFGYIKQEGYSIVESAIRFNAAHKEITVVLPGMSSIAEVEQNVACIGNLHTMDIELVKKNAGKLDDSMNKLCTGCKYCEGCPVGINIPHFLDAYNLYLLKGDKTLIPKRLGDHWQYETMEDATKCVACGMCEKKCTQKLPIIDRLKFISELIEK